MRILILNGGYLSPIPSGGDKHLLEIATVLATQNEVFYAMPHFVAYNLGDRVHTLIYRSAQPHSVLSIIVVYVARTLKAVIRAWQTPADVLFCSPGLFDMIPALIHRHHFNSRIGVYLFHISQEQPQTTLTKAIQAHIASCAQICSLWLLRLSDVVFTSAPQVRQTLLGLGFDPDRVVIQYPAVNKDGVQKAIASPHAPDALFVGRLVRKKGIFDIVELAGNMDITIGIVGEGEEREELIRRIADCGLTNRIRLYGRLSDSQLYSLLKGCRFLIFPSYEEGYGIAIAEAILAGKPVIAYQLPHYDDAFAGALLTVPLGDVAALKSKIMDLLSGAVDVEAIRKRYDKVHICDKDEAAAMAFQILSRSTS